MADWEAIRNEILTLNVMGVFGSEEVFVNEFLEAGSRWAPNFCENWVMQHEASEIPIEFFKTARQYRIAVEKNLGNKSTSMHGNAATLQGHSQPNQADNQPGAGHQNSEKDGERKCLCGQFHLFKNCPYIVKSARNSGWKEDHETRSAMRKTMEKNPRMRTAIKHITDTNVLEGINRKGKKKKTASAELPAIDAANQATAPSGFIFGNMALSDMKKKSNPLFNSVIYDSGCDSFLTHDKSRFVGEIAPAPANQWCDTPIGEILVEGYGTITKKLYDVILIMIDRLTKYSHIISFKETYSAKQLGYIVLNRLIKYHELLKALISDRDKLFIFNY